MKDLSHFISPIEEVIADAKIGKAFILVDSESRENEGDLVIPAEFVTPENINFMIRNCSGIICLSVTQERADILGLKPMVEKNQSSFLTPFAISIEAKHGVTTGVSAFDRAHTIKMATKIDADKNDIVSPGHIFPLIAKNGGVLEREGHTEGSVDVCKLAGLSGCAAICEIMNLDGTMSRLPEIIEFAKKINIKIGTIEDLVTYRKKI